MEKIKVFLPDVRISYPSLVEPRAGLQGAIRNMMPPS